MLRSLSSAPGRVCEITNGRFVEAKQEKRWLSVWPLWSNPAGRLGRYYQFELCGSSRRHREPRLQWPTTASPRTAAVRGSAGRNALRQLRDSQREYACRRRPAPYAALLSLRSLGWMTAMGHIADLRRGGPERLQCSESRRSPLGRFGAPEQRTRVPVSGRSCRAASEPLQSVKVSWLTDRSPLKAGITRPRPSYVFARARSDER